MNPTPDIITLFMWGYQHHFRRGLEALAKQTLKEIAPDLHPRALLVGTRHTDAPGAAPFQWTLYGLGS